MALYAIGDLHLALSTNKSMEVFGKAWENYVERIGESLARLSAEDTLILAGDTSWGMSLEESEADFRFLEQFPCRKILLKGNHDYWWNTNTKMQRFFDEKGFTTLQILHNNAHFHGPAAICGSRGWFFEEEQSGQNEKVLNRELGRIEASFRAAEGREILCFLHYPPLYVGYRCEPILRLLSEWGVKRCYYGHLHSHAIRRRIEGVAGGVDYSLISADYLAFVPKKICD